MTPAGYVRGPRRRGVYMRRDGRTDVGAPLRHRSGEGFTLIELMFAVAVIAILGVLAQAQFVGYAERSKVATAKADIVTMTTQIIRYQSNHDGQLPMSLDDIGRGSLLDPWGNTYHYTNLTKTNKGKARKDRRLNPINSDYDLFSAGKNGVFKPQVSQKDSVDDVIRARDGAYIGLAEDF